MVMSKYENVGRRPARNNYGRFEKAARRWRMKAYFFVLGSISKSIPSVRTFSKKRAIHNGRGEGGMRWKRTPTLLTATRSSVSLLEFFYKKLPKTRGSLSRGTTQPRRLATSRPSSGPGVAIGS
jgi:hypothetical protein